MFVQVVVIAVPLSFALCLTWLACAASFCQFYETRLRTGQSSEKRRFKSLRMFDQQSVETRVSFGMCLDSSDRSVTVWLL